MGKRTTVIDYYNRKVTARGDFQRQRKVHFTSQRVKNYTLTILHTNFNGWENTGTFNIKDL